MFGFYRESLAFTLRVWFLPQFLFCCECLALTPVVSVWLLPWSSVLAFAAELSFNSESFAFYADLGFSRQCLAFLVSVWLLPWEFGFSVSVWVLPLEFGCCRECLGFCRESLAFALRVWIFAAVCLLRWVHVLLLPREFGFCRECLAFVAVCLLPQSLASIWVFGFYRESLVLTSVVSVWLLPWVLALPWKLWATIRKPIKLCTLNCLMSWKILGT